MRKNEARFTTIFKHYLEHNMHTTGAWEIKYIGKDGRFDFKDLQDHQLNALQAVKHAPVFAYKIPDDGFQKPFDMFTLRSASAHVVLAYEHEREYVVHIIDVDAYVQLRDAIMRDTKRVSAHEGTFESFAIALHLKGIGFQSLTIKKSATRR